MAKDYGHRMADHAWKHIKGPLATEFDEHLDEWHLYAQKLIANAKRAVKNFEGNLEKITKEVEAERLKRQQMALLTLSLAASPALSFVSAALAGRVGPKLFGNNGQRNPQHVPSPAVPKAPATPDPLRASRRLPGQEPAEFGYDAVKGTMVLRPTKAEGYAQQEYAKAKAMDTIYLSHTHQVVDQGGAHIKGQMLGEVGARVLADLLVNRKINEVATAAETKTDRQNLQNAIARITDSVDLDMLETTLNAAWVEAKKACKRQMQAFADKFNDNRWGDEFWRRLGSDLNTKGMIDDQREQYGYRQIRSIVDKQREMWAKEQMVLLRQCAGALFGATLYQ
ncbi:MAG: hypothetical protein HY000_15400 [Planctomycetes bacterium]|nr:hypothetical protein [Planctomycetota bacterium]